MENCQPLIVLNLQANILTRTIPQKKIRILALSQGILLSHNSLTGAIPSEVANLINLEILDFSFNKLSVLLPITLGELICELKLGGKCCMSHKTTYHEESQISCKAFKNLNYLNLSFNNFKGEVPIHGIFENTSAVSVLGNSKLCGGNPLMHLAACPSQSTKKNQHSHASVLIHDCLNCKFISFVCILFLACCMFFSTENKTEIIVLVFEERAKCESILYEACESNKWILQ